MVNFAVFNQRQLNTLKITNLVASFDEILVYRDNEDLSSKIDEQLASKIGFGDMLHIDSASISIAPPEDFSRLVKLLTSRKAQLRLWFSESQFQISCLINCSDIIIEKTAQKHLDKSRKNAPAYQKQQNNSDIPRLTNRELDSPMKINLGNSKPSSK